MGGVFGRKKFEGCFDLWFIFILDLFLCVGFFEILGSFFRDLI